MYKWLAGAVVTAFVLVFALLSFTVKVDEGKVAVVYSVSEGAKEILTPGWHLIGLFDKTYEFSVRQDVKKTTVEVNTSDGKKITIPVTYNARIDEDKVLELFKLYGVREESYYYDTVVQQQLQRISKDTITKYSTIDIFTTKMSAAGDQVQTQLVELMNEKGFIISELALLSPELDAETQAAIDSQVQAQQENALKLLQLENDKIDQQKAQQQAEADQIKRKTEADTKAYEIKAAADAEAYANEILSKSLNENLLKKMELEARNKHGWVTIQGGTPIVDTTK